MMRGANVMSAPDDVVASNVCDICGLGMKDCLRGELLGKNQDADKTDERKKRKNENRTGLKY